MNAALIAPSANRSRTRLGILNATKNASISLPAPNSAASTCSRTSPRTRLASVATPATPADRARPEPDGTAVSSGGSEVDNGRANSGAGELLTHELVDDLAVDRLPGQLRHR